MKNITCLSVLFVLFMASALIIASDDEVGFSLSIPPEIGDEFKSLFQAGKYAEAEALYRKAVKEPNTNWLTLLKMKQGKIEEGVEYLKQGINRAKTPEERKMAIKRALGLISDVSLERGVQFQNEYAKELETDIGIICSRARRHMVKGEFDQAKPLVMDILSQTSHLTGQKLADAENAMGNMVAELYVHDRCNEALEFFAFLEEKYPKFRLDPGMQLLSARIMARAGQGMESLKKIDWIMETFPDYCKKNPDMILRDKARAYEVLGDRAESKKLLEEHVLLAQKNPAYQSSMVEAKLNEFRQWDEIAQKQQAVMEAAKKNPFGLSEEELKQAEEPQSRGLLALRIVLMAAGVVMIVYALYRLRKK